MMHNSGPTNFARVNDTDTPFFVWDDALDHERSLSLHNVNGRLGHHDDGPLADYEKTNIPITVINESVGTLGTFAVRITGLAYVGDHDVHLWGNPTKGEELRTPSRFNATPRETNSSIGGHFASRF